MWVTITVGFILTSAVLLAVPCRFRCTGRYNNRAARCIFMIGWPYGLVNIILAISSRDISVGIGGRRRLMVRMASVMSLMRRKKSEKEEERKAPGQKSSGGARITGRRRLSWRMRRVLFSGLQTSIHRVYIMARRAIRLQALRIDGEFGDTDPAMTGMVYGWSRALDHCTPHRLHIRLIPNFRQQALTGSVELIGLVFIYPIVWFSFSLVIALVSRLGLRSIRETVRELRGKGVENGG